MSIMFSIWSLWSLTHCKCQLVCEVSLRPFYFNNYCCNQKLTGRQKYEFCLLKRKKLMILKANLANSTRWSSSLHQPTRERIRCPSPEDVEATSLMRGRHLKLSTDVLLKISSSLSLLWLIMPVPSSARDTRVKMKKQCPFFAFSSVSCVFFLLLSVCESSAQIFGSSPVSTMFILAYTNEWKSYVRWDSSHEFNWIFYEEDFFRG